MRTPDAGFSLRVLLCSSVWLAGSLIACGDSATSEAARDAAPPACDTEPALHSAFVVLPDTQFYSCGYAEIFQAQTRFIRDNAAAAGLGLVIHTGDIVDRDTHAQWSVAADALHMLDGRVPYLLAPGNHDLNASRTSLLDDYFDPADLSHGGCAELTFKQPDRIENAYAIVRLRGEPWLFLGLEFGPRDATIAWADAVLREHAALPAVLFTHAYLYDEARYDRAVQPLQPWHPDTYQFTPDEGIGDGQDLWEALVEPNENVRLVLSGHVIPDGIARARSTRRSGSVVHEVLANYQRCDVCPCTEVEGGGGYLRIFELSEAGDALHVSTYSPYYDRFLMDADNDFALPL